MKLQISLFILLFFQGCSFLKKQKRLPASINNSIEQAFWNYQANQIIQYDSNIKKEDLLHNKQQFYLFMGAIQKSQKDFFLKTISGNNKKISLKNFPNFLLKRVNSSYIFDTRVPFTQMSYNQWNKIKKNLILKSIDNIYSIIQDQKIINLWGIQISQNNFNKKFLSQIKIKSNEKLNLLSILKPIIDGHRTIHIRDKGIYSFPNLIKISDKNIRLKRNLFYQDIDEGLFQLDQKEYRYWYQSYINNTPYYTYQEQKKSISEGVRATEYFKRKRNALFYSSKLANNKCDIKIHLKNKNAQIESFKKFKKSLSENKSDLMKIIKVTHNEYNELASLALGILRIETKGGRSIKYWLKEGIKIWNLNLGQYLISKRKEQSGRLDANSRGLTQIKNVREIVKNTPYHYFTENDLADPFKSAIVTMLVLKQKYKYLKHFRKKHSNINKSNWINYLYYFYQGSSKEVTKGTATPRINKRINIFLKLLENMMIFESC